MYRIVDWDKHFENNRSRELKSLDWVPVPNKHDGDGYTELLSHPHGPAHFGAWVAIVQVASKCEPRGTLIRDGQRAHDAGTISRKTHFPAAVMQEALSRLCGSIGWIEEIPDPISGQGLASIQITLPQEGAMLPQERASKGSEKKRTEGNGTYRANGKTIGSASDDDQSLSSSPGKFLREGNAVDLAGLDWGHVTAMAEAVGRKVPAITKKDRRAWLRFAVLAEKGFSESWLMDAVDAVVNAKVTRRTKQAHFVGVLRSKAKECGIDKATFVAMLRSIEIPDDVWESGVLEIRR